MSHKVHPYIFRIGQVTNWKSRWFNLKEYASLVKEDVLLRKFLEGKLKDIGLEKMEIERTVNSVNVMIFVSRPGLLIGRGGEGIEKLKDEITKFFRKNFPKKKKFDLKLTVEEVKNPDASAQLVSQNIAAELERRMPFRRLMKQKIEKAMSNKEVKGIKIAMNGRLDGAEIARSEWLKQGRIPLQTLRANIEFGKATAFTTYGTVGIKVWIYKGEVFEKEKAVK